MNVLELRCTSCLAPLDPSRGPVQRCIYCGTTLMLGADASVSAGPSGGPLRLEQCGPNKIQVIKVIREHTGLGLKEALDLAESAPCVLAEWPEPARIASFRDALEAVGARASGGPARATRAPEVPSTSTGNARVLLAECGPNKISVIKVIREHTGLGLKEAKDLAEAAPCVLAEDWDPARAARFSHDLVAVGARVR